MRENVAVDPAQTGKNIRKIVKYAGMKADDLAEICGCSLVAVYAWYSGRNVPSVDNLVLISNAFGISIDDIVARKAV